VSAADGYQDEIRPSAVSKPAAAVAAVLVVLGLIAFVTGDAATAWRAFHVNYLYFAGLAQGGVVFAAILNIVGANWPGPVRRLAESLGAWIPVTLVLGIIDLAGASYVYAPWWPEFAAKPHWLNKGRLIGTDLGVLLLLGVLSLLFMRASLVGAMPRASAEQKEAAAARARFLAPPICLAYAFGYSFLAFDQVMSLTPTWFSNLFGGFFAWGGLLSAVAGTTVLAVLHRNHPGLEGEITKSRLHDLGKLIFAFSIFWMYLFFAQYLVIWYGNLPEETQFFHARLGSEFLMDTWYWEGWWTRIGEPWVKVTLLAWICIWVVPFWFLLGQRPKKTWWFVGTVAFVLAFGHWLERNVMVWPSYADAAGNSFAWLGTTQIGMALGFLGAFALVNMFYRSRFLAVPTHS
jgi:hypothetical protein